MNKDKFLHVPIDKDFKEKLENAAKIEGRSLANFARFHLNAAADKAIEQANAKK